MKGPRCEWNGSPTCVCCCRGIGDARGPHCRLYGPSPCMSAISCSSSRALCSSSCIIWRTLACIVTRWRLASSIYFYFCRWLFLMRKAHSFSWSSTEMPMTSPTSMVSSPSRERSLVVVLVVRPRNCKCVQCRRGWGYPGTVSCWQRHLRRPPRGRCPRGLCLSSSPGVLPSPRRWWTRQPSRLLSWGPSRVVFCRMNGGRQMLVPALQDR
jgi:hypothetical protein